MRSNFMNFVPKSMYMRKRVSGPSYREAAVHAQNSGNDSFKPRRGVQIVAPGEALFASPGL
jgi:hypothetical protein